MDNQARKRIIQITEQMLTSMVIKGELDPEDEVALRAAAQRCAADATAIYNAALEFVSG